MMNEVILNIKLIDYTIQEKVFGPMGSLSLCTWASRVKYIRFLDDIIN